MPLVENSPITLAYERGTLLFHGGPARLHRQLPGAELDPRTGAYRAEAKQYRAIVEYLRAQKAPYCDAARAYGSTEWSWRTTREPFPHQVEALEAWWSQGARGIAVLPTGTGKTHLALMAIHRAGRPALVVTPTLDLLSQWYSELRLAFRAPVGLLGGGYFDLQPLTATTYDSAYIHVERWGNRFGLVVFDECHHLPGASYLTAAAGSIAPYRLGLTATPERADGADARLTELIGPVVYHRQIRELTGCYLAEYHAERLYVELTADERRRYDRARRIYREFVEDRGIALGAPHGWQRFLRESSRSPAGRAAFQAYREQRRIATAIVDPENWTTS